MNMSNDNTKQIFVDIHNYISDECMERLTQIGTLEEIKVAENGFMLPFKRKISFLIQRDTSL